MTTPTLDPANAVDATSISAFAQAVRARLDDLPIEDVDDLTDGLAADLAEQASDDASFTLPDPVSYADELRSAAGFAERSSIMQPRRPLRERVRATWTHMVSRLRVNPAAAWVLDLLSAVRPFWWVLRGAIIAGLLNIMLSSTALPRNPLAWVVCIALILVSVQWGRGRWLPWSWLRGAKAVVSIIAIVATVPVIADAVATIGARGAAEVSYSVNTSVPGLSLDGERVRNVFAYDADGNLLTNVQLFTQDGTPLTIVSRDQASAKLNADDYFFGGGGPVPVPYLTNDQRRVWNVFPLRELTDSQASETWMEEVNPDDAGFPLPPFTTASKLDGIGGTNTPTPGDSVAPPVTPTATPVAEPAPQPVPTP